MNETEGRKKGKRIERRETKRERAPEEGEKEFTINAGKIELREGTNWLSKKNVGGQNEQGGSSDGDGGDGSGCRGYSDQES
ncbi:hypothetical protein M0802_000095 [Mischocyttarus mexicanus]|nr:hypothetical protein M0802_000095 [Mischocyttarus mexicanus]